MVSETSNYVARIFETRRTESSEGAVRPRIALGGRRRGRGSIAILAYGKRLLRAHFAEFGQ